MSFSLVETGWATNTLGPPRGILMVTQLVLAELRERKGAFLVLDGKQRLTALLQFAGGMSMSESNRFRLSELPVLKQLLKALQRQGRQRQIMF